MREKKKCSTWSTNWQPPGWYEMAISMIRVRLKGFEYLCSLDGKSLTKNEARSNVKSASGVDIEQGQRYTDHAGNSLLSIDYFAGVVIATADRRGHRPMRMVPFSSPQWLNDSLTWSRNFIIGPAMT
jgi:hypothetical protein